MPSRTNPSTSTAVKPPLSKRFELPLLEFKFASLTEGTDIPPPLPSPVLEEPTPPATPLDGEAEKAKTGFSSSANKANGNGAAKAPNGTLTPPVGSPTLSNRPGSIRRLISRTLLNGVENGAAVTTTNGSTTTATATTNGRATPAPGNGLSRRPLSRSSSTATGDADRRSRRGSGWFRRLRGGGGPVEGGVNKRSSLIIMDGGANGLLLSPTKPPPPMIPEVDVKDEATLGSDWIREIKVE